MEAFFWTPWGRVWEKMQAARESAMAGTANRAFERI
jgi:hypothetical protein